MKRMASSRLDLPEALGPTTKRRVFKSNSMWAKLRQFRSSTCVSFMGIVLPSSSSKRVRPGIRKRVSSSLP